MGWIEDKVEGKLESLAAAVSFEAERTRLELAAALSQSIKGARIDGALPRQIRANAQNLGVGGRLLGWSLRNSGATTVTINFRDGHDVGGDLIGTELLGTNSAWARSSVWFGVAGASFGEGLWVEVTGGTVDGAVYLGAVD